MSRNRFKLLTAAAVGAMALAAAPLAHGAVTANCGDPNLLFCENFDQLTAGPATSSAWTADTNNGTLTVEAAAAGTGNVLHVHTDANGKAFLTITGFAAPANSFFGRAWVKIDAYPTAPDWAHFTMVELTGTGSTEIVRPVGGQNVAAQYRSLGGAGGSLFGIGADGGATGDWLNWKESAPAVGGSWQCVEWQVSGADNGVTLWINGVDNPDLRVTGATHGGAAVPFVLPTVNTVKIGWQLYQTGSTPDHFDLRYDNIAIGSARIGCGTAPA